MNALDRLANTAATNGNPIDALRHFRDNEQRQEDARNFSEMRFVGYVIELGYDSAKIITNDPYKLAVGGIPRGSFLIMTPAKEDKAPPHFTLLRVTGVSPTPLSSQVQQTYFELQKKSMPELDVWTQSELQWGALDCDVLGMFYADPEQMTELRFSGDVNNVVSAHRYKVFSPNEELLNLIINGTVKKEQQAEIGTLRTMECGLFSNGAVTKTPVRISMKDFKGCRTAMFGKTRLGKSNVVKLLAQAMIEKTSADNSVGQLIFDINGEYANDNPQDGNRSLRSANADRSHVYALTKRENTPSKPLRLNFYEQPSACLQVLSSLLDQDNQKSNYIRSFGSVILPEISDLAAMNDSDRIRAVRKIQAYWAILYKAGFFIDEERLKKLKVFGSPLVKDFNCQFNKEIRKAAYSTVRDTEAPENPKNIAELKSELEVMALFKAADPTNPVLNKDGKPAFDAEMEALLGFLNPTTGSGPAILRPYLIYHAADAGNFQQEIIELLNRGQTVILDLGNATDTVRRYFSNMLSTAVFREQEKKFVNNSLGNNYVQLYFEEAHNLFPPDGKDLTGVYARFAKEGAKFHIGMVYSTQSPSTINKELLAQTENFFVGHLSSQDEAKSLARVQVAFAGVEEDILRAKTPGYMRMLTMSHRFVVPTQAHKFEAQAAPAAI